MTSEMMEDPRTRVACDIILAMEAFGKRYFNFEKEGAAHLESAVQRAHAS